MNPGFLEPEVRCGYKISGKMKRVWAVQLDLLDRFSQVCESNNLQYFLSGGSLLGAVRHGGFIPWDDDVDVIMPRTDYNRLCDIAGTVFTPPYFFQTTLTDSGLLRTHAQLRNSNTTGYIMPDAHRTMNKGIFLDIFVLDSIPDNAVVRYLYGKKVDFGIRLFWLTNPAPSKAVFSIKSCLREIAHRILCLVPTNVLYRIFDRKILAKYAGTETAMVGDMTLGWRKNVHWERACYSDYVLFPFETLWLRAPVGYDAVLTKQYGDYMTFPPPDQRGQNQHGSVFWDPDRPYTFYFPEEKH